MARCITSLTLMAGIVLCSQRESIAIDETESLALLVASLDKIDNAAIRISLMRGMLSGLAGYRKVTVPDQWSRVSAKLAKSGNQSVRDLSQQLSQIFGDEEAIRRAITTLQDQSTKTSLRLTALRSLLMQHNDQVSAILESLMEEPELRLDAIRGYSTIENPNAPQILLRMYAEMEPPLQRAIIETLATRRGYAKALVVAIKNKTVARDDVPPHVARSLSIVLGDSFVKTFGNVRQLAEDRAKLMAKYKKMITDDAVADADASKGRALFEKTCASCHLLYGTGGKIGPDLTGSNRANLDYILLNSVDPSYDVPDGYKMVMIQTVDGRLVNGVIAEEDNQRVVLKTVEQPTVVIAKEDIEARKISPKSMMPDGQLEQMKPQEVIDLIKYLRTTEQVELEK